MTHSTDVDVLPADPGARAGILHLEERGAPRAHADLDTLDWYDPLDETAISAEAPRVEARTDSASVREKARAVAQAFADLFRQKQKPLLWPY